MTFHEYFANFSPWFWAQVANHLWQSTLFASLAVIGIALLRASSAKARYAVWLIASAKFVLPLAAFAALGTLLGVGKLFSAPPKVESNLSGNVGFVNIVSLAADDASTATAISTIEPAAATYNEIYCLLTLAWAIGCAFLFALWWKRSREFKRLLAGNSFTPSPGSRETELLGNAQIRMGAYFPVALIISDFIREPTLIGIWKPTVIIPRGLGENLSNDEFELILMHELAHVARRDNLVGVLQMALCCLLWFHPLVWFIKRKLLEERERACDEAVLVRHEGEPDSYLSGLLKVVRFGLHSEQSAGLANTTGGANLKKRLESIMNDKIKKTNFRLQQWLVGSTAASLILLCLIAFVALAQTESAAASSEFSAVPNDVAARPEAEFYEVEVYANGKVWTTLESNSPKSGGTVLSYSLYHIPDEQTARTAEGKPIYAFQLIATDKGEAINVEILALLEDLQTVSDRHPLHEFRKQTIASYDVRAGETMTVSEMSKFGVNSLELKSVKFYRSNPSQRRMRNNQDKAEIIKQIEASPNVPYRVVGNEESPLKITEAVGSQITNALYTKYTGQTIVYTGADGKTVFPNVYSAPLVKMINNSQKTIIGFIVAVTDPRPAGSGKWRGIIQGKPAPQGISIPPGQSYTVNFREKHQAISEKYWLVGFTDPANFYVSVGQVHFDDGTIWKAKDRKAF